MSAEARNARLVENEVRLRSANELVNAGREDELRGRKERFLCECSNDDCTSTLELRWDEYRHVRAHDDRFVIRPGHETAEVDRVVEGRDGFVVVEKTPRG